MCKPKVKWLGLSDILIFAEEIIDSTSEGKFETLIIKLLIFNLKERNIHTPIFLQNDYIDSVLTFSMSAILSSKNYFPPRVI